ncbi:MAG TPA: 2OG-Fe(II) oxygenase, partial [Bacteroidia bacterium]|nr:2OG-Fe(II) oxygenase [Bacteroidia bacterium]
MENIFDQLINSYLINHVGISDHFLSDKLAGSLKDNLNELYSTGSLKSAGIGNDDNASVNKLIRSDKIFWLDKSHQDKFEDAFFLLIDEFILHLNSTCYAGITGYEFHYAFYEAGSFYKRHL